MVLYQRMTLAIVRYLQAIAYELILRPLWHPGQGKMMQTTQRWIGLFQMQHIFLDMCPCREQKYSQLKIHKNTNVFSINYINPPPVNFNNL